MCRSLVSVLCSISSAKAAQCTGARCHCYCFIISQVMFGSNEFNDDDLFKVGVTSDSGGRRARTLR